MKSVRQGKRAGGFTIVEVLSALVILSIVGTAVCGLTMAAMNSDRFLRSANTAQMEVEWAMRRIANNIREAQTGTITAGSNTLSMTTQADSTHGYPNGATVSYSLGRIRRSARRMICTRTITVWQQYTGTKCKGGWIFNGIGVYEFVPG